MERKKTGDFRPSGLPEHPHLPSSSSDRFPVLSLDDIRRELKSDDIHEVSRGAYELRRIAQRGDPIGPVLHLASSKLRMLLDKGAAPPEVKQSMPVPKEGGWARVYLAESMMLAAKNGQDIDAALPLMPLALECQDVHVRNFSILALGYHARNGGEIMLYVELVARHLSEPMPMNREAAVWTLKEAAVRGRLEAHAVLLALGSRKDDDVFVSDVRACCHEVLRKA